MPRVVSGSRLKLSRELERGSKRRLPLGKTILIGLKNFIATAWNIWWNHEAVEELQKKLLIVFLKFLLLYQFLMLHSLLSQVPHLQRSCYNHDTTSWSAILMEASLAALTASGGIFCKDTVNWINGHHMLTWSNSPSVGLTKGKGEELTVSLGTWYSYIYWDEDNNRELDIHYEWRSFWFFYFYKSNILTEVSNVLSTLPMNSMFPLMILILYKT